VWHIGADRDLQCSPGFLGFTFFLLGFFRLGSLIGFFPRHILVGCIGGVGVFLIITGLNISTRLQDDEFSLSLDTLFFFLRGSNFPLWAPAFILAALLRVITSRWHHQLILPTCACFFLLMGTEREHSPVSVDRSPYRFFDHTGCILRRCPDRRTRPRSPQEREVGISGCEERRKMVPILYLLWWVPCCSMVIVLPDRA
jgi:hypothetical protein